MKLRHLIKRDERGAAALEFALIAPLLLSLLYGICQFGILFFASSGLNTAVGEAARFATVWPTPTKTQIEDKLRSTQYGLATQYRVAPVVTPGPSTTDVQYYDITLSYSSPVNFIFYRTNPVTLSESRRVWVASVGGVTAGGTVTPPPTSAGGTTTPPATSAGGTTTPPPATSAGGTTTPPPGDKDKDKDKDKK